MSYAAHFLVYVAYDTVIMTVKKILDRIGGYVYYISNC